MRFTLDVTMANTEGALERILGRLRQRSFNVCALNAGLSANMARMDVRVTLESARPIELAIKQLAKLIDVEGVEIIKAEEHHHHESKLRHPHNHTHGHHQDHRQHAPFEHRQPAFDLSPSQIGL
ncbi:MAG: ACT domain-containing protein [Candidatus Obscuribacterales bacterium]|nr:ACT domain-containing protein [Candidatus Obscuribacterales bacterium]